MAFVTLLSDKEAKFTTIMKTATLDYLHTFLQEDHHENTACVCTAVNGAACGVGRQPQLSPLFSSSQGLPGSGCAGSDGHGRTQELTPLVSECECQWCSVARKRAAMGTWLSCCPWVCQPFGITRHI